jgi:hypothetical protein
MFCFRHLRAQIWYAHPHTTFTCISIALSIAAVLVNWVCILFFSLNLRAQGPRWALPGRRAKRAAGPKMACSFSNYVYTHRRNFLHFCRKRELDLTHFVLVLGIMDVQACTSVYILD